MNVSDDEANMGGPVYIFDIIRLPHYSMHTQRSSVEWIVRVVRFHGRRSREDLFPAEPKIESCVTDLAVHGHVAAATQNQAMNALVVLYKRVLNHAMEGSINAVRADKKINVPVVMTREEVVAVISLLDGTAQLVAELLYGNGLRIMEAVRRIGFSRAMVLGWCKKLLGHNDVKTTVNKGAERTG